MRRIITTTFVTLDGVMQAPGGPGEDEAGGFAYGGWAAGAGVWDDVMGSTMDAIMGQPFELLLGRRTYDIFAAYWPTATVDQEVAVPFNRTIKHVVSREPIELAWHNSELITGDVVPQLEHLKAQAGPDLWVHGSGNLIQTLLAHDLIDRMLLWTFPVTVGSGKRLFAEGAQPRSFRLTDWKVSTTGVMIATYEPAGQLEVGTSAGA
ncbi:MAG TPA: dihydrofolate reductase family protein [Coriobacteriia bacterium]|nr:dihydrofolate reductase family protein [Coriobacteriia bacterium]